MVFFINSCLFLEDRYLEHFWTMFWLIVVIIFWSQGPGSNNLPFYASLRSKAIELQSKGHKLMRFRSKKNFSVDAFLADLECLP